MTRRERERETKGDTIAGRYRKTGKWKRTTMGQNQRQETGIDDLYVH